MGDAPSLNVRVPLFDLALAKETTFDTGLRDTLLCALLGVTRGTKAMIDSISIKKENEQTGSPARARTRARP